MRTISSTCHTRKHTAPITRSKNCHFHRTRPCSHPAGKLQMHILAAISEFERARIAERVMAGLARAKKQGKRLGRPEKRIPESVLAPVRGLPIREAAKRRFWRSVDRRSRFRRNSGGGQRPLGTLLRHRCCSRREHARCRHDLPEDQCVAGFRRVTVPENPLDFRLPDRQIR